MGANDIKDKHSESGKCLVRGQFLRYIQCSMLSSPPVILRSSFLQNLNPELQRLFRVLQQGPYFELIGFLCAENLMKRALNASIASPPSQLELQSVQG